mmetsp:Transcript_17444/g.28539  ORF Transcript_17444/g.28539 Transcript_17444/m.28539 type:complete len:439 (+) Transcript_17444:11-1327(+)
MSSQTFLVVAALLICGATYAETDPWSFLSVRIPSSLSDMAICHASYGGTVSDTPADADEMSTADSQSTTQGEIDVIILTGGCSSPDGNQFIENGADEFFVCAQLSKKAYAFEPIPPKTQFQAWTGEFRTLADMPRERSRHASVQIWSQQLCVIGGRDVTDTLVAEIDCYDPNTDYWTTIGKLPEEYLTSDCAAFAMGNSIYLIGGYGAGYEALDQVIVIDVSNLDDIKFIHGPSLGTKRGDIDVAVLDDEFIYVSGGFTKKDYSKPLNTVEQLTIGSKTWIPVDALNEERGGKQLVTLKGKIYALGGEQRVNADGIMKEELLDLVSKVSVLDTVEVLSPKQDVHGGKSEWRVSGEMPSSLVRFGASEWEWGLDGVIFVFGGQSSFDTDCECFPSTDKVMVFDASRAFKYDESNAAGASSAVEGLVAYYYMAIFTLMWL